MTGEERGEGGHILLLLMALPAVAVNRRFRESGERSVEMTFTGRVAGAVFGAMASGSGKRSGGGGFGGFSGGGRSGGSSGGGSRGFG